MKVIIAEKPSVAKNIADAMGSTKKNDGFYKSKDYYITWAFGHLLELFDMKDYNPDLGRWQMDQFPYVPNPFRYKVKQVGNVVDAGAQKQLTLIQNLIAKDEVEGVISACDYDREGQIIGDIILEYLNVNKPIERLLLNEWTAEEVLAGMSKLVSNQTLSPLRDAGIGRQWADWLIGINLTSCTTLKYQKGFGKALNIGRVLLPTLKIIFDRDQEIKKFQKETYYKLDVVFKCSQGQVYDAKYILDGKDKFDQASSLKEIEKNIQNCQGVIHDKQVEKKREYPGPLFNLTGLQGFITGKAKGWTSDKVLKVAQGLYEKKLITYPRTSSLALEESLVDKAKKVLDVHKNYFPFKDEIVFQQSKRIFDNSKVESHSAIIPTYLKAKGLTTDEKIVYEAVLNRFIAQFMPVAEHEEATMITSVQVDSAAIHTFQSKGRVQLIEGWRKVESIQSKENPLPSLECGDSVTVSQTKLSEKSTQPPKHHTEKTLLKVMETCGKSYKKNAGDEESEEEMIQILSGFSIGTPATRAETIAKLKRVGYIDQKGKYLKVTSLGEKLVDVFPVKSLLDLEYTGRLEKVLFDIGKGEIPMKTFLDEMIEFVQESVEKIKTDDFKTIQDLGNNREDKLKKDVLGKCPGCGSPVVEGEKGFGCINWKSGCKFVIWKEDLFLKSLNASISKDAVKKLLAEGELYGSKFLSKKGAVFSAYLSYIKDDQTQKYRWKMRF